MDAIRDSWTRFKQSVRGFDTSHQLGVGAALGVIVGLIPVDSALPYVIGIIAILSTGNLLCFCIAAVAAYFASPYLDPVTHSLGTWILTFEPLESFWSTFATLPGIAWTRFNNSIVMGTLLLGVMASIPVYTMTRTIAQSVKHFTASRWQAASLSTTVEAG